ncbi:MAG: hypothetical protein RL033_3188 [Pseudomonadota bacterium]
MSVPLEVAVRELRLLPLSDPKQHLKAKGRELLLLELATWRNLGLIAHVLVVDPEDSLSDLLDAWRPLQLDPQRDLLLVFNTRDWVARGWGLSESELRETLAATQPKAREIFADSLIHAVSALGSLARERAKQLDGERWPALLTVGGPSVLLLGGALALVIRRRARLARSGSALLNEARSSAERTYTELILACEDLPEAERASELQVRAAELKRRLDLVVNEVRQEPAKGNDPVRIGQLRQLENELAALRSSALQLLKSVP